MNKLTFSFSDINQSIPERFEKVTSTYGNNTAIAYEDQHWTYQELNQRVNQVAHAIKAHTSSQIDCVAFLVDYSPNMIVTTLAILKSRKIYLAIHPQMPELAQRKIIEDAQPELMVTTRHLKERTILITKGLCPILVLDEIDKIYPENNPDISIHPDELSTIFYTSGTTGQPKGVVKSHRTILHRVLLTVQQDNICSSDRQSLLTYSSFASSEADIFGSLLNGAALYLFDIISKGFKEFYIWLEREKITVLHPPVLLFRRFLSTLNNENLFPELRLVLLAGDTVLPSDINQWKYHFTKNCTLIHRFSSTETGLLTILKIENDKIFNNDLTLAGFPVTDKYLFLINEDGQVVPKGQIGELVVKSPYLAQGYWRKPEKTSQAFSIDSTDSQQRIYRTGDLGQFQENGSFRHIGRQDHQVKIRGYRVDLREIELVLMQLPEVLEVAVIAQTNNNEKKICAFLVLKPGLKIDSFFIRQHLLKIVPEWSIPSYFQVIDTLPLTPNGKIDRSLLSSLNQTRQQTQNCFIAPQTEIEEKLTKIWEKVLETQPISITDNFFEIGGNSLIAVQLFAEIEKEFSTKLPFTTLFQIPTIEKLAIQLAETYPEDTLEFQQINPFSTIAPEDYRKLLSIVAGRPGLKPRPESLMTNLHINGKQTPIFFCANGINEALPLAKYFEQKQLFYLLESGYSVFYKENKATTENIKALASYHVQEMLLVQPQGDYFLIGYSFGSFTAYEIAKQLKQKGKTIILVILDKYGSEGKNYFLCYNFLEKLTKLKKLIQTRNWNYFYKKILFLINQLFLKITFDSSFYSNTVLNNVPEEYQMQGYQGKIHLFLAQDRIKSSRKEKFLSLLFPYYGWTKKSVEQVYWVSGDHLTMCQEPNVKVLKEHLTTILKFDITCS